MARYYHFDVARWEGEGGAPATTAPPSAATRGGRADRKNWKTVVRILSGALVIVLFLYARRKA